MSDSDGVVDCVAAKQCFWCFSGHQTSDLSSQSQIMRNNAANNKGLFAPLALRCDSETQGGGQSENSACEILRKSDTKYYFLSFYIRVA